MSPCIEALPYVDTLTAPGSQSGSMSMSGSMGMSADWGQGLTLVHFSAQFEPFMTQNTP